MKCFLILSHEEEIYTPDEGNDTRWITVKTMVHFKSLKKALLYLQKNICDDGSRNPVNFKTLYEYQKECKIFCFLNRWEKLVKKHVDIWEEYSK